VVSHDGKRLLLGPRGWSEQQSPCLIVSKLSEYILKRGPGTLQFFESVQAQTTCKVCPSAFRLYCPPHPRGLPNSLSGEYSRLLPRNDRKRIAEDIASISQDIGTLYPSANGTQAIPRAGRILVEASDNILVSRVQVAVQAEDGRILEKGDPIRCEGDWWEFTSHAEGKTILAEAWDLPGHVARGVSQVRRLA
jgi:hypothetical protein